ncbi:MAG: methyltransferase domain-containing protein [Actinobacteria bacterium]|uniref:Unannotated protein n=1 Tax=freshwater metagenome TaxID=449393 RepID=A0A6J6ZPN5_9ZZZZ|nr:methyltransferase domain-containing protein [Actinomycetota bacterium]MTA67079.1 methyltransferase domain-containing protein [Actinomycetota bacterium]
MRALEDTDCRLCGSKELILYLDLGELPIADAFTKVPTRGNRDYYFPLKVNICSACGWSQLSHVVDSEILYQRDYPYDSRVTDTGEKHWSAFAEKTIDKYSLNNHDLVLDIGSNTGALLQQFRSRGIKTVGVDPSKTASDIANQTGISTINDFFNESSSMEILNKYGAPKVITSTNSFAHVDDLVSWMKNVSRILDTNGVLIIESPHILELLRFTQFDTVYHEHLSYISIAPLIPFFKTFGFRIIDVEKQSIHGGSIRIHVSKNSGFETMDSVPEIVREEENFGLRELSRLNDFALAVTLVKTELSQMLLEIRNRGESVAIASAPAKGMTLINYIEIDDNQIASLSDKSDLKIGRYAPGTAMLVETDSQLLALKPDYILILAWNFAPEIMKNLLQGALKRPQFIIPIPRPVIMSPNA